MNKVIALLLAGTFCFTLASCEDKQSAADIALLKTQVAQLRTDINAANQKLDSLTGSQVQTLVQKTEIGEGGGGPAEGGKTSTEKTGTSGGTTTTKP